MRKYIVLLLLFSLLLTVACGEKTIEASNQTASEVAVTQPVEMEESIEVDENLLNVEITLPASYFEDETFEEVESAAKAEGVKEVKQNEDGSYTYVMSKKKHREMMNELKQDITVGFEDPSIDYPSVVSVENNDDLSEFTVTANREDYESGWDAFIVMEIGMTGMMYQTFDGVNEDDIKVVINVVDVATNEVFSTVVYPDALEEMEG